MRVSGVQQWALDTLIFLFSLSQTPLLVDFHSNNLAKSLKVYIFAV